MTLPLPAQQTATIELPGEPTPWQVDRLEDQLVIATPALPLDPADRLDTWRGCLVANLCSEMAADARFALRDAAGPCLEISVGAEQLEAGIARLQALRLEGQAAMGAMDYSAAQDIELALDTASQQEDADPQVLALLEVLQSNTAADAELAALLSVDLVQGAGILEPDDESWVMAVGPSYRDAHLSLTVALALLGGDEQDGPLLQNGLTLGSARVIGPAFRIGCDPMADTLLLSTDVAPHQCDAAAIKEAIGGLLLLAQRLEPLLYAASGSDTGTPPSSLQPTAADSLSAYQMMRA